MIFRKKANEFWQEIQTRYEQRRHDITHPVLTPAQLFISADDVAVRTQPYAQIIIQPTLAKDSYDFATQEAVTFSVDNKNAQPLQALESFLLSYDGRILFCAETTGRREVLLQLFAGIHLSPKSYNGWEEFLADDAPHGITIAPLDNGLVA